jgi:hypothetical protein
VSTVKTGVRLNHWLWTTSTFDSGALGPLVHVIHRFATPGAYQAVVLRDGQRVGTTCFRVTSDAGATQLNIDLAAVTLPSGGADRCACREHPESAPAVSAQGYVLFHAARGPGGYAVLVGEAKEDAQAVFDSRALTDGDLVALALIEPTSYAVTSPGGAAQGEIEVTPAPPGTNLREVAPVYVEAARDAFQPARISVHAAQAIVFRIRSAGRIVAKKRTASARRATALMAGTRRIRRRVRLRRPG